MRNIIQATKIGLSCLLVSRGIIGQIALILLLVIFDAACNAFSISLLFSERIADFISNSYPELSEIERINKSSNISLVFSLLASTALGSGIFILSLIGNQATQTASNRMAIISFCVSFIGFVLFITPTNINEALTINYAIQLVFCVFISSFSPYLTSVLSRNLAISNREEFQLFQIKIDNAVSKMMETEVNNNTSSNNNTSKRYNIQEFLKAS